MNATFVCLVIIAAAGLAWVYQTHPEVYQDIIADIKNDPNGVRASLANTEKTLSDEETAYANLQKEYGLQEKKLAKLSITYSSLQDNKTIAEQPQAPLSPPQPIGLWTSPDSLPAQANWTWQTSDGKIYTNVVIKKIEPDCVTVLFDGGGACIDICKLPPSLQNQLHYNPAAAAAASAEKQKAMDVEKLAEQNAPAKIAVAAMTTPTAAGNAKMTAGQIENIEKAIADLNADISFMENDQAKLSIDKRTLRANGATYSTGGYTDRITDEQAQVNELQSQLAAGR